MLALISAIATTGLLMKFTWHTDIPQLKAFFIGLMRFNWQDLPSGYTGDILLYVHLALVAVLMLVFSFSKLLHAPGLFFSPTRNQIDNPRERRLVSGWAAKLETEKAN